jgi:hypothetical protein
MASSASLVIGSIVIDGASAFCIVGRVCLSRTALVPLYDCKVVHPRAGEYRLQARLAIRPSEDTIFRVVAMISVTSCREIM